MEIARSMSMEKAVILPTRQTNMVLPMVIAPEVEDNERVSNRRRDGICGELGTKGWDQTAGVSIIISLSITRTLRSRLSLQVGDRGQ